jgi:hypothetical protein
LDDVSVYSLVASQFGLIVTELTETQATSLQSDITGTMGATAGLAKAEIASRLQATESQGSQILRKAIVQTTFKELYEATEKLLVLRGGCVVPAASELPIEDLARTAALEPGLVVDPASLTRGRLLELQVELEAEQIFHAGAFLTDVLEIIRDDFATFGVRSANEIVQLKAYARMLDKLLVGLVPIRGRAVDFEIVEQNGKEWIVHSSVVASMTAPETRRRPLYLVGVAEQSLFWKDVRRILFSRSSYRVLARLGRDGMQKEWTPLKMVDLLRGIAPELADLIENTSRDLLSLMSGAIKAEQERQSGDDQRVRTALLAYGALLAKRLDVAVTEQELEDAGAVDPSGLDAGSSADQWRLAFAPISEFIEGRFGLAIDAMALSECRVEARNQAGIPIGGDSEPAVVKASDGSPVQDERFLDAEIIAIYW